MSPRGAASPPKGARLVLADGTVYRGLAFGAEAVRRGADGLDAATPLALLAGITLATLAAMPFAAAAALRVNLR